MHTISRVEYSKVLEDLAHSIIARLNSQYEGDLLMLEANLLTDIHTAVEGYLRGLSLNARLDIALVSDNAEAYVGVYSDSTLGRLVKNKGLAGLAKVRAHCAMKEDLDTIAYALLEDMK